MARCGCGSTCNCVFLDGDCIDVVGSGTVASPYRPNLLIDPAADNEAVCNPGVGLLVRTNVRITDTPCINLSGNGTAATPLSAALTPSPNVANLLTCDPTGALVILHYVDSDCINLSGFGTLASPFMAEPIISGDVGNVAECRGTGFYVPATTMGTVDFRATLRDTGTIPTVMPASGPGATAGSIYINFDVTEDVVGLIPYIVSDPIFLSRSGIEVPVGGAGIYQIELSHPAWDSAPFTPGDLDIWLSIDKWDGGGSGAIGTSGATRYTTVAGAVHTTPYLHVSRTVRLDVGDVVYGQVLLVNYAAAFPGATLSPFPTIGPATIAPYANLPFLSVTKIGTP